VPSLPELFQGEEAATGVEYAVLLALILMAIIAVIQTFGDTSSGIWANNNQEISAINQGS
jgi:Flp pilus assembly pilin Flp